MIAVVGDADAISMRVGSIATHSNTFLYAHPKIRADSNMKIPTDNTIVNIGRHLFLVGFRIVTNITSHTKSIYI